jgi:tRNA-modifying protein YgfZ
LRQHLRDILEFMASTETSAATESSDTRDLSDEYRTLTEGCGLLDRSERGKLALSGPGAVEFLNGQVTNELADLREGEGRYAAFLTHKGKMLGDLRILAVHDGPADDRPAGADDGPAGAPDDAAGTPSELLLDTERVTLQALFDMIRRFKVGYEVELHKRTLERSLFSLVGPAALAVAARASVDASAEEITRELAGVEHAHRPAHIAGCAVRLVRTAEPAGVDVLCAAAEGEAVRDALVRAGAQPVSAAAVEILRVECGRPRYGIDLDDTVIPQEAGLNERAVSFTKGCYVGQETVARLHYRGKPNRHLRGLRFSEPIAPGAQLGLGERPVGLVRSSVLSPVFGPIGLALLRREVEPGMTVAANGGVATVVELPFSA